jgi:hypothetical protein
MCHTRDNQYLDSQLGKLYDIWGILGHKLLGVVLWGLGVDGDDVLVALAADILGALWNKYLLLVAAVLTKLWLECC